MRTILAGSRDIVDASELDAAILESGFEITTVICGCAAGVDTLGYKWAMSHSRLVEFYPADWNAHGRRAGYVRNCKMADAAGSEGALIAVMRIKGTPGTKNMISIAEDRGLKVFIRLVA